MTETEWSRAVVRVDPKELAAWIAAHPNNVTTLPLSTKADNYGLAGKAGKKAKSHNRGRWDSFQRSAAESDGKRIMEGV